MRLSLLLLVLFGLAACGRRDAPAASPADSATAAMDALEERPSQDSVRMEGDRYAAALVTPAGEQTLTITLGADGNAERRSDYGSGRVPGATPGAWTDEGSGLVATRFDEEEIMWRRTDDSLVAVAYNVQTYGQQGLRLARVRE